MNEKAARGLGLIDFAPEEYRPDPKRRALAIVAALGLELLLIGLLLSLGLQDAGEGEAETTLVRFQARTTPEPAEDGPEPEGEDVERSAERPRAEPEEEAPPQPIRPPPAAASERPAPAVRVAPSSFDLSKVEAPSSPPRAAAGPAIGPPDSGSGGDTPRVGTAPNGEPLYAASWYREPREDELRGYLSTASGPGWGLIACRTVPDFRVEDCVALEEYPGGSNINRAVLAAAWQFRVRPPRLGGQYQVGAWVRIRIEYDLQRR
ncbi:hypothetical protein [Pelagerythrobacter rhizovicinus]|uniref:Energy transducer TonB n=1 Tax=Pelagerythrobacter rhizovicinus TaxID=2268576 RepID=A0A4Q2KKR7_9SPHN|nr:hypothetical protein [Pelagerythrobacter rhizovicinus]RXZ65858.1 hypothetical protein ETX26_03780 [Pelagerythrobacter rhizovicinus]